MSQSNPTHMKSTASSFKMLRAMVGIGIVCALLIVLSFEGTLPRIEKNKAEALEKAIFKVLPGATSKVTYQLDENNSFISPGNEDKNAEFVYAGFDENDKLTGIAIEAKGMGFADVLHILYGYDPKEEQVVGFYVLASKETPGLGDKIEKDDNFLANFKALDVSLMEDQNELKNVVIPVKYGKKKNPWEVDGITGATISSRAIGNIMGSSTERWIPLIYGNKEIFKNEKNDELDQ